MAVPDSSKDELRITVFSTREGSYKLLSLSEYSRPTRVNNYHSVSGQSAPVRVSFVNIPDPDDSSGRCDKLAFNFGKELYIYVFKGVKKAVDLNKPVDKKLYKGITPTCHNFNQTAATAKKAPLLVGFSTGQIQLIDPFNKEINKFFNDERLIDKTKVTCIKWLPESKTHFLVSHSSGQLYLYSEDLPCGTTLPSYQLFKSGNGYTIYTCKTKSTRNPLYRWVIGSSEGCSINEFSFSPCGSNLAVVSSDGFLRVFQYDTMELLGCARSYFGGFLCVCWSPDGKYVVVGGEDDLVTMWSFPEKRVVARGQGHHSWVSVVSFDPYTTSYGEHEGNLSGSDDEGTSNHLANHVYSERRMSVVSSNRNSSSSELRVSGTCYRLGSVSHDTQLCLWDITEEDILRPSTMCSNKQRANSVTNAFAPLFPSGNGTTMNHNSKQHNNSSNHVGNVCKDNSANENATVHTVNSLTQRLVGLSFGERSKSENHKRNFSLTIKGAGGGESGAASNGSNVANSVCASKKGSTSMTDDPMRLIGTACCPRFDECPVLEPLVCKKLAHERLTELVFRKDCFVTACQDGYVYTWARPGHTVVPLTISNTLHRPHHHSHPYTNINSIRPNDL